MFSEPLLQVERGEEVLVTKRGQPVAVLVPYRTPAMTAERRAAIDHAIKVMQPLAVLKFARESAVKPVVLWRE